MPKLFKRVKREVMIRVLDAISLLDWDTYCDCVEEQGFGFCPDCEGFHIKGGL